MSWQPRVLKKRQAEFVVEGEPEPAAAAPAAASSSEPPPAAASSSNPAWNGAADLDDLEEEAEPKEKRPRTEEAAAPDPKRDEVAEGAPRLAEHIKSNAKFNKVAAMAYALLESGRVTSANAGAFFTVLEAAMDDPRRLREQPYRVAYRKLFSAAIARASLFPPSKQWRLRLWELHVITQIDLYTDDTFQFNRAAKTVRESLHGLPCIYKALEPDGAVHLPEDERGAWAAVLFECVDAAMRHHVYGWAKPTCDTLVKTIIDRRQNFEEDEQAEMQVWNAKCKGHKVVRQQEYASSRRDQSSYERKEAEWSRADISTKKGDGGGGGGGLDGWCAKQGLN